MKKERNHQQEDFSSLDDEEAWQLMDLSLLDFKGGDLAFKRNLKDHTKTNYKHRSLGSKVSEIELRGESVLERGEK